MGALDIRIPHHPDQIPPKIAVLDGQNRCTVGKGLSQQLLKQVLVQANSSWKEVLKDECVEQRLNVKPHSLLKQPGMHAWRHASAYTSQHCTNTSFQQLLIHCTNTCFGVSTLVI